MCFLTWFFFVIIRLGVCIWLGVCMVLSSVDWPIIKKKTYFQVKTKWFFSWSIWHENGFWSKKKDKKDKKQNHFLFFVPCTKQKRTFFGQKWKTILFFPFFFCFFFPCTTALTNFSEFVIIFFQTWETHLT